MNPPGIFFPQEAPVIPGLLSRCSHHQQLSAGIFSSAVHPAYTTLIALLLHLPWLVINPNSKHSKLVTQCLTLC